MNNDFENLNFDDDELELNTEDEEGNEPDWNQRRHKNFKRYYNFELEKNKESDDYEKLIYEESKEIHLKELIGQSEFCNVVSAEIAAKREEGMVQGSQVVAVKIYDKDNLKSKSAYQNG